MAKFKQTSKVGNKRFRQLVSDFGPSLVIVMMSLLAAQPFIRNNVFIGIIIVYLHSLYLFIYLSIRLSIC